MKTLKGILRPAIILALCALMCIPGLVAKANVHVVFIGNSITYGATLASPATQAPPIIVGQLLRKRLATEVEIKNCGVSGYTTFNFLPGQAQFNAVVSAAREMRKTSGPIYFSIMLGTNDSAEQGPLGSPVSTSTYKSNMKKIIDRLHEGFRNAKFIINYPIWYSPNTHNGAVYLQAGLARLKTYHPIIDEIVSEYAKTNPGMVVAGSKDAFNFFEGNTEYFTAEAGNSDTFYLHPNASGARKLAEFWAESIAELAKADGVEEKQEEDNSGWVRGENLLTNGSQIQANSTESDQFTTDNLLRPESDGYGTNEFIWHTSWTNPLPATTNAYLQFHLNSAESDIFFSMISSEWNETYDTPKDIDIYATNTPDDESSWKKVASLRDLVTEITHPVIFDSQHIGLGDSYTDLRFVVLATNHDRHSTNGSLLVSLGRFQIARAKRAEQPKLKLQALLDDISAKNPAYEGGTEPGYYSPQAVEDFVSAFEAANYTLAQASATDEELTQAEQDLRNAYNAVEATLISVADGYYYIKNALPAFEEQQGTVKAMCVLADGTPGWDTLNEKDPKFLFKLTRKDDTSFSIQSVYNGKYLGSTNGTGQTLQFADTDGILQVVRQITTTPQFNILNREDAVAYNALSNNGGAGTNGSITLYGGGANTASAWQLLTQSNTQLIDSLIKAGATNYLHDRIEVAINETNATRDLAFEYAPLITDGSQLSANSTESNMFTPANLIRPESDGYGTGQFIWHNSWSNPLPATTNTYLQARLNSAESRISFTMTSSEWEGTYDTPKDIDLYATNTPDDESSWKPVAELRNLVGGITHPLHFKSQQIDLGDSYTNLRFEVKTTNNNRHSASGSLLVSLGRFQIYSATPTQLSEYYCVDGMKEACDNYDQVVAEVKAKLAAGTATAADIDALHTAANAIKARYVNRDSVFAAYTGLLAQAQTAYDTAVPTLQALITNGSQITSNSVESEQFTPANLIRPEGDGFGTNQYIYHSSWSNPLPATEYPYLQVHLNTPQTSILFTMLSSEWNLTYDTPNDIEILATNNPDDEGSWTSIRELSDMIPEEQKNSHPIRYTSPMIDLGADYTDVRLVVKSTVNMRRPEDGMFFVSLGRFQMYTGVDPETVQYNYSTEVKAAADALKALIDAGKDKTVYNIQANDIPNLQAAIDKLLDAYADTADLVKLYNNMLTIAENMTVGKEIGTADDNSSISTFINALAEARGLVSTKQPKKSEIAAATNGINKAYAEFMTHVRQIEPGKWYYIRSAMQSSYCSGKAMFLASANDGAEIHFGQYNGEDVESPYTENPFAMWRFAPIEGTNYFSIQNLATSHSIAPTHGRGNENRCHVQTGYAPFRIDYIGGGKLQFVSINNGEAEPYQLHAQENDSVIVPWATDINGASCWLAEPVDDEAYLKFPIASGTTSILTLPFNIPAGSNSLATMNPNAKTYSIKGMKANAAEGKTTIELTETKEVKAGVPFIIVENAGEDAEGCIYTTLPATVDTTARENNGLVGTLTGATLSNTGLGYFANGKLTITDDAGVNIGGMSGWINFAQITEQEGSADLTITIDEIVNSINAPHAAHGNATLVNVYTPEGTLVRRNVKATDATSGLAKGIYIVGKKKVLVK